MPRLRTADPAPQAPDPERLISDPSAHFRRLLGQRRLFGQLAECHRSHQPENTTTDMLDDIVQLLSDDLQSHFPEHWEPLEAELLVAEISLQHNPDDGPMVGCGICHEQQQRKRLARHRNTRPGTTGRGNRARPATTGRNETAAADAPREVA